LLYLRHTGGISLAAAVGYHKAGSSCAT
jgi:hypothetical protein